MKYTVLGNQVRAGSSGQYAEYQSSFAYLAGGHGAYSTTPLVSGITQSGHGFAYTYDEVGNILSAAYNGGTPVTYAYDNLGQLTRVNDLYDLTAGGSGTTWVYAYDRGGNILSKTAYIYTTGTPGTPVQTIPYVYDGTWKDKLASYNGTGITYDAIGNPLTDGTYDAIGNPLTDGTWTYTWQAGRQLASMTNGTTTAEFDYNADGLRIRKTVGSTVTEYTLHGKNIVHLTCGSVSLHFFYDAQSHPAVVEYNNGSTTVKYAYVHNLQGDIIAILDPAGATVVQYRYDAWGKQLSKTGAMASTLGTYNPFRYRGYAYDEETGLYYLRSRYYNPVWGRFVNTDSLFVYSGRLFAHNIFMYCYNNPIVLSDISGLVPSFSTLETDTDYDGYHSPGYWDWVMNHTKWEKEEEKIKRFLKAKSVGMAISTPFNVLAGVLFGISAAAVTGPVGVIVGFFVGIPIAFTESFIGSSFEEDIKADGLLDGSTTPIAIQNMLKSGLSSATTIWIKNPLYSMFASEMINTLLPE